MLLIAASRAAQQTAASDAGERAVDRDDDAEMFNGCRHLVLRSSQVTSVANQPTDIGRLHLAPL
jgi:hypothetical protein